MSARTLVVRGRGFSGRVSARTVTVALVLVVACAAAGVLALGLGTVCLAPGEVLRALVDPGAPVDHRLLVFRWRLPRVVMSVVAGGALGVSGAIFQSLTRNPLGSPDVIGFSTGSYTGALVVMLGVGTAGYLAVGAGAVIGGLVTALLVYLLAWRRGVQPFRLVIVGIGLGAMLAAVNGFLLMRVSEQDAMLASVWAAGSLNGLGWAQVVPAALVALVLGVAVVPVARPLAMLEMGDAGAVALGVRADGARAAATVLGVACTALVTAAAGPIGFVALAAPQIARRLTRGASLQLVPAALTGAALLAWADLAAQVVDLPVGVLTVCVGGLYLTWLLGNDHHSGGRA